MQNRTSTAQADAFVPQNHPGRKKRAGANAEEKASACSARNDNLLFFGPSYGTVETVRGEIPRLRRPMRSSRKTIRDAKSAQERTQKKRRRPASLPAKVGAGRMTSFLFLGRCAARLKPCPPFGGPQNVQKYQNAF